MIVRSKGSPEDSPRKNQVEKANRCPLRELRPIDNTPLQIASIFESRFCPIGSRAQIKVEVEPVGLTRNAEVGQKSSSSTRLDYLPSDPRCLVAWQTSVKGYRSGSVSRSAHVRSSNTRMRG